MSKEKFIMLLNLIENLRNTEIKSLVDTRIKEFKDMRNKPSNEIFKELCFCILTANFNAEKSIKIQKKIDNGFLTLPEEKLAEKLKKLGHRFPRTRAKYIVGARKHLPYLKDILNLEENFLREWLVKNVKGLGYKEASHFLRNIGYENFAIIDFHILDLLSKHEIIKKPKTLSRKKYFEIEEILRNIALKLNLTLAELDLYLWYTETGKILK